MKKNKDNKRKSFNKIIYTAFLFFITSIFFSRILEFNYSELIKKNILEKSLATNKLVEEVDGKIRYIGPDIRILEIEPADSFKLTDVLNTRVTTGIETVTRSEDNKEYKIEITHMTMAEFIGKTEQLNGKYDVIVIGRYVDEKLFLSNGEIISDRYNQWYNTQGTTWFRDYVNLNNDITNKKANEIKEFIESGQLVYIDKNIENITDSKLKNNFFNSNEDRENLIKNMTINNSNEININNIIKKYIERINKNSSLLKPNIVSKLPKEDSIEDELGDISKRNMEFNIYSNDLKNEEVTIKLYLDLNADTLFKEEEVVKEIKGVNITEDGYKLEYNLYEDYPEFIGYLNWRIEVVKDTIDGYSEPIKSYFDGDVLFRRLTEEKRVINILQIEVSYSDKNKLENYYNDYYNNGIGTDSEQKLLLATDIGFQNLLKEKEVNDYEINVDIIDSEDFYKNKTIDEWMKSKYVDIFNYVNNVKLNESKYDIVVIGFGSNNDIVNLSEKAVEELKEYVSAGRSLILTHDTLKPNNDDITQMSYFVKGFRDTVGQSRYLDPNNKTSNYNDNTSIGINGSVIDHDSANGQDIYRKEVSSTLLSSNSESNSDNSTKIWESNKTSLTSYPFKLEDEIEDEIEVKVTNHQHFQLNLEDENVIPMFNLTEYNAVKYGNVNPFINRYDSRNSYYAYSKDNITFTSIGENQRADARDYSDKELKLFFNTIFKAGRSGNNKPIITGLENVTEVVYGENFNFSIIVKDIDQDKVKLNKVLVNGQDITTENNISDEYQDSGVVYDLIIKKSLLLDEDKEVTITLEAEDQKGAKSIKEYKIKPMKNVLSSSSIIVNSIVNIEKDFSITLKANDINNIEILEVNYPSNGNGIYSLKNIDYSIVSEGLKIKGSITSFFKYFGKKIPISIKYRIKGQEEEMFAEASIISNSDYTSNYGKVNINVKDKEGNNIDNNINLILLNNTTYSKEIELNNGESKISNLELGEYKLSIKNILEYKVEEININGEKFDFVEDKTIDFILDSQNNTKEIEIIVSKQQNKISNLRHGLYERIDNNGYISIIEDNNFEIALESMVNFASDFNVTGEDPKVNLTIDSNLNISNTYLKIYEFNGAKLEKISEDNLNIEKKNNEYEIIIKGKFNECKILILYSAKLPKDSNYEYFTNKINVNNGEGKLVIVKAKKSNDGPSLPDLF